MRTCIKCLVSKLEEDFPPRKGRKSGRYSHCRVCQRQYQRDHYKRNQKSQRLRARKRKSRIKLDNQRRVFEFLLDHSCVDCGESDPIVLEFDHVSGDKKAEISVLCCQGFKWDTILSEIGKCEVRCANCHRRKTAIQHDWSILKFVKECTAFSGPIVDLKERRSGVRVPPCLSEQKGE